MHVIKATALQGMVAEIKGLVDCVENVVCQNKQSTACHLSFFISLSLAAHLFLLVLLFQTLFNIDLQTHLNYTPITSC